MSAGDLRLDGLTKSFGRDVVVDDLSLHVAAGSFFALVGPSGCGKTTTLRMVAGLERPDAGRVLLGERDVPLLRPHERPVNTVFQSYALFPHLSVGDNVAFGPRRRGVPRAAAAEQAREALALVELDGMASRRPSRLSGGQQQRVALARALVNRPEVLLLDEPLGALDLRLRRQMQLQLKRIQAETGLTFVHVTHDQEEAMSMADTVAVMRQGRIEQLGPPAELYDLPRTRFVATFLGQSNLAPVTVVGAEGDLLVVELGGQRVRVLRSRAAAPDARRSLVGFSSPSTSFRQWWSSWSNRGWNAALMSAKSITQPLSAPGSPDTRISIRNECPCSRAHLWPGGTLGSRCAASMVKVLKMSMARR